MIPEYADGSLCLSTWGPDLIPSPSCPDPNGTLDDVALWNDGKVADDLGLIEDAVWYYSELVLLYPGSKYAAWASDRLKDLGKYESEENLAIAGTLEAASASSEQENLPWQAAMQYASAQCVLAQAGDIETATANLQNVLSEAESVVAVETATLALLEIATYPSVGSICSLGGYEAQRQLEALHTMQSYRPMSSIEREAVSEASKPECFHLGKIYPNPFNPSTSITLHLVAEQEMLVEVYNLQGQLVSTLHRGPLEAGSHHFHFDGSALASGCYVLRAASGQQAATQKMLLVK